MHRHRGTSETVVVLRGRMVEEYYDDLVMKYDVFISHASEDKDLIVRPLVTISKTSSLESSQESNSGYWQNSNIRHRNRSLSEMFSIHRIRNNH